MRRLRKTIRWYGLLNKRFLKKYIFTLLLLMIPFLVLAMRAAAGEESGVLRVLLYQEGEASGESAEAIRQLLEKHGVICYEKTDDPEDAYRRVRQGKADCVWIFPENLREAVREYLQGGCQQVLTVFVREDTVQTRLAREQLFGVIYPVISYEITRQFVETRSGFEGMGEETLAGKLEMIYGKNQVEGSIFRFSYLDDVSHEADYEKEREEERDGSSYLTAPLRGMLALLIFLCGMAITLFYFQDEKEGIFLWMPVRYRRLFPLLYILTGTADAGAAAYLALYLSGTFTGWKRELLLMVLYVLAVTGFCNFLRTLNRDIRSYGACIPVLILISLVLCPVFLNFRRFPAVQYLLPAYYYLNSLHSNTMLCRMIIYAAAICAAGLKIEKQPGF